MIRKSSFGKLKPIVNWLFFKTKINLKISFEKLLEILKKHKFSSLKKKVINNYLIDIDFTFSIANILDYKIKNFAIKRNDSENKSIISIRLKFIYYIYNMVAIFPLAIIGIFQLPKDTFNSFLIIAGLPVFGYIVYQIGLTIQVISVLDNLNDLNRKTTI